MSNLLSVPMGTAPLDAASNTVQMLLLLCLCFMFMRVHVHVRVCVVVVDFCYPDGSEVVPYCAFV